MKKRMVCLLTALLLALPVLSGCESKIGWVEEDGGTRYYLEGGKPASGWVEIDGNQFYFDAAGCLQQGFHDVDGVTYYFNSDGSRASGWIEVEDRRYYLRQSGSLVTGWLSLEGQRYYLTQEGITTGLCTVDGSLYIFDQDGRLASGWAQVDGGAVYGDINGHPVTGWHTVDGQAYYFREDHLLQTGWAEIDGFTFCFHDDGTPLQGITPEGEFASNGQLVTLVNPWHTVPENYTVELTPINSNYQVASVAYTDYLEMINACENAGHQPVVCSGYRSREYQQGLFDNKIQRLIQENPHYSQEEAAVVAARSVAVPGTSEHQLGLALDIIDERNWNLNESQAQMPTQQWLMEHSWRYGWILRYPDEKSEVTGIIYEPWHYRYVGKTVAAEIHELGVCLEEYLQMLTAGVG